METIDEYIKQYPLAQQEIMLHIRAMIHEEVPEIEERMSWQMPTFYYYGNLIHFAVNKNHLGIYPGPSGVEHFADALTAFKTSKGSIQFPWHKEIPFDLIRKIIIYRKEENKEEYMKKHGTNKNHKVSQ